MQDYCKYQQSLISLALPLQTTTVLPIPFSLVRFSLNLKWHKTFYGLNRVTESLLRKEQPLLAFNLLIEALERNQFLFNHAKKWWHLMAKAMQIAQSLELDPQQNPLLRLVKVLKLGPQPWQGYEVAFCFASLSFYSFLTGKYNKAIEYVNIANHAEKAWGYPEYLLGWYGILLEGIEPIPHFIRAIQCNSRYWQFLQDDPLLAKFPEVLKKVSKILTQEKNNKLL